MSVLRTSRELAERVEISSQKHPNRLRRWTWGIAAGAALVAAGWLTFNFVRGENRIYQAGPVSTAHRMFENDCAQCHVEWSLGKRLVSLNEEIRTVSNEKCIACHEGAAHFGTNSPDPAVRNLGHTHAGIACASCHREHQGREELVAVSNQHCVQCHADLDDVHAGPVVVASDLRQFDRRPEVGAHPGFAVERLLKPETNASVPEKHWARQLIQELQRPGEARRWQDRAQIRFNHAKHLKADLLDKDGKLVDLSKDCGICHEPDSERRYMRPINYEKHCASCHTLNFDTNFPEESVPHEQPEVVRGFLTDFYARRAKGAETDLKPSQPPRPLPGRNYDLELTEDQTAAVQQAVTTAEQQARDNQMSRHIPIDQFKRSGGCAYCHELREPEGATLWQIEPPRIPERWLTGSRFNHDSHRALQCTECHRNLTTGEPVTASQSTGDVLLPGIDVCRECHASDAARAASGLRGKAGARTNCVECHNYHERASERTGGTLSIPKFNGVGDAAAH